MREKAAMTTVRRPGGPMRTMLLAAAVTLTCVVGSTNRASADAPFPGVGHIVAVDGAFAWRGVGREPALDLQ